MCHPQESGKSRRQPTIRITSPFRLLLPLLLALVLGVAMAWAFAEEPLGFQDPYTGTTTSTSTRTCTRTSTG